MDHHHHIIAIVALCLASCSPKIVERVVVKHDTTSVHHRDSIFTKDSIYIREWMKGDTIHIYEYRDRIIYKDRWRDSIVTKVDSFAVETVKEVRVEKPLSVGQRAKIGLFWWLVLAVAGLGVWTFRKPIGGMFTEILKKIF